MGPDKGLSGVIDFATAAKSRERPTAKGPPPGLTGSVITIEEVRQRIDYKRRNPSKRKWFFSGQEENKKPEKKHAAITYLAIQRQKGYLSTQELELLSKALQPALEIVQHLDIETINIVRKHSDGELINGQPKPTIYELAEQEKQLWKDHDQSLIQGFDWQASHHFFRATKKDRQIQRVHFLRPQDRILLPADYQEIPHYYYRSERFFWFILRMLRMQVEAEKQLTAQLTQADKPSIDAQIGKQQKKGNLTNLLRRLSQILDRENKNDDSQKI